MSKQGHSSICDCSEETELKPPFDVSGSFFYLMEIIGAKSTLFVFIFNSVFSLWKGKEGLRSGHMLEVKCKGKGVCGLFYPFEYLP